MRRRIAVFGGAAAAAATAIALAFTTLSATASTSQTSVVSDNPENNTPHVVDGQVKAITVVGRKVIVGGKFTGVKNAGSTVVIPRNNIFAYDYFTGKVDTGFVPKINGQVATLAWGANYTVYAGGAFTTVNGGAHRSLTRLYTSNGGRVGKFMNTYVNDGWVYSLWNKGGKLYVGGSFTKIRGVSRPTLARVDAETGAVDTSLNLPVSGSYTDSAPRVQYLTINPAGTKLLINGNFKKVGTSTRYQIAMIDLGTTPKLSSWYTTSFASRCNMNIDTYLRDMDFSPDGKYFVVVTTGGANGPPTLCDTASRWETTTTAGSKPTWINYTGGDSLYAVAATGPAVYVGGHQRWLDNPEGHDSAGDGAVSRPGIGAIHPTTGKALSWNPTRTRGHGVEVLTAISQGLMVGSDTDELGGEWHQKVGTFPVP